MDKRSKKKVVFPVDRFFNIMERQGLSLTFDDVRLITDYSEVLPIDADLSTSFSRHVPLKCPLVSAPMDRVTTAPMAIAMAKAGGLGIIHRGRFIGATQVDEVRRVKTHLNGRIDKPVCVFVDQTIEQIENMRRQYEYNFYSFPVIDHDGQLMGFLSEADFDFCVDHHLTAADIMTRELVTASSKTSLKSAYNVMHQQKKAALPLIDKAGKITGMYVWSDVKRNVTDSQTGYNLDADGHLLVGAAIGTGISAIQNAFILQKAGADVVVIDTSHGDSKGVYETLRALKNDASFHIDVMVGNISEGPSAKRLAKAGADGIKVGQGPGSICTTRIIAGIGAPQVTAVYECAKILRGSGVPVCADGGINYSGDIVIAIGIGAASIMGGRLFAGTDEAPGKIINTNGILSKEYRGMGSVGAMEDSESNMERYHQENKGNLVPQGVEGVVPYRGSVNKLIEQYLGGLRNGMGYVGACTIAEMQLKIDLRHLSHAGIQESHPHDILITKFSPNYKGGE